MRQGAFRDAPASRRVADEILLPGSTHKAFALTAATPTSAGKASLSDRHSPGFRWRPQFARASGAVGFREAARTKRTRSAFSCGSGTYPAWANARCCCRAESVSSARHHFEALDPFDKRSAHDALDIAKAQLNLYRLLATQVSNEGLVLGHKTGLVSLTARATTRALKQTMLHKGPDGS